MTLRKRRRARASEVRRVLRMIDRLEVPFGDADRARHEVLIVRLEEALRRARDPDAARRLEEARRLPESCLMGKQIDHSMSGLGGLARRLGMKQPMAERGYEEQVAAYLEGWGFLQAASVVAKHAAYVAQAKDWGMSAIRCAKNVQTKEMGR